MHSTTRMLGLLTTSVLLVSLGACGADPAEVSDLEDRTAALEERVEALTKQVGANALARTDDGLADILAVVQAVERGRDPTSLSPDDQVGFCRGTGWNLKDLGVLGSLLRSAAQAQQAAIAACKEAGNDTPTVEQLLETDAGKQWQNLAAVLGHVHEHMIEGAWAGAREHLYKGLQLEHAPATPAGGGDGG